QLNEGGVADALDEDVAGLFLLAECEGGDGEDCEQKKECEILRLQGGPPCGALFFVPCSLRSGANFAGYHKRDRKDGSDAGSYTSAVLVVDGVSIGQHALKQDARNQDAAALLAVEHDVHAMLMRAQAKPNVIAEPAERWIEGQRLATRFQFAEVTSGLGSAPFAKGVVADAQQVGLGAARESKRGHG